MVRINLSWALVAVVLALAWGCWQYDEKRGLQLELARVDTELANQKLAASKKLLQLTERANDAESSLSTALQQREAADEENQQASRAALDRLRSLWVRDPPSGCRCGSEEPQFAGTATPAHSARNRAAKGGEFSAEFTGLLLAEAEANDRINDAYTACRADSLNVRRIIDEYNSTN